MKNKVVREPDLMTHGGASTSIAAAITPLKVVSFTVRFRDLAG